MKYERLSVEKITFDFNEFMTDSLGHMDNCNAVVYLRNGEVACDGYIEGVSCHEVYLYNYHSGKYHACPKVTF